MPEKKKVQVTITMADPKGGVFYKPTRESAGKDLMHGETHEVDEDFAQTLVHQKRAVLADPDEVLTSGPLTTDSLTRDPGVESRDPKKTRSR